jgi:hypothetical protein
MNDPEGFLSRWARRKRDVAKNAEVSSDRKSSVAPAVSEPAAPNSVATPQTDQWKLKGNAAEQSDESTFDIASLPSIESITEGADIRPFLAAGVPLALRQAALRRYWATDPHVRGIVELAENTWDFTASGVPGFDLSPPSGDLKRMLADVLTEKRDGESETSGQSETGKTEEGRSALPSEQESTAQRIVTRADQLNVTESSVDDKVPGTMPAATQPENETVRQAFTAGTDTADIATQNNDAAQESTSELRRRSHGRAIPK